jgi:hypothetical protein
VKNINALLATRDYRKMDKRAPSGFRDPDHPEREPRYAHYYAQLQRQQPRWYFDLYPNVDLDGRARFADRIDVSCTLYVDPASAVRGADDTDDTLSELFESLVSAVGFPVDVLHRYAEGENRN